MTNIFRAIVDRLLALFDNRDDVHEVSLVNAVSLFDKTLVKLSRVESLEIERAARLRQKRDALHNRAHEADRHAVQAESVAARAETMRIRIAAILQD